MKLACLLVAAIFPGISVSAESPITITVADGARQTFQGFGTSLGNWEGKYQKLAPDERAKLSDWLWHDLKFNSLRLWMNIHEYAPTPGARDLSVFRRCYVDSRIIADARSRGVKTLLLAPEGLAGYMKEAQSDGGRGIKQTELAGYTTVLADFISQLKKETGISIEATGIQNEPNVSDRFTPVQMVECVKLLRAELDRRDLPAVKIIAPEQANCDDGYYRQIELLKKDPVAWGALAGVSSHSYNMAVTDQAAAFVAAADGTNLKDYWMNEASDNGAEELGDHRRAASLAARYLNDMNHRVTHWMHFLGFEVNDPRDNATRIIAYEADPFRAKRFQKFATYRQLSHAFDMGAVFRDSTSSEGGDMTWTYGKKPRLTAAAARNPDGTWAVGVANYTADDFRGVQGWSDDAWNVSQGGHTPAQSFSVTVRIEELRREKETRFRVCHSASEPTDPEFVIFREGEATIEVGSLEVVTLRSVAPE